jgi:hypothetical protein
MFTNVFYIIKVSTLCIYLGFERILNKIENDEAYYVYILDNLLIF